jgi:GNAT superfamily N-acetyltransferase
MMNHSDMSDKISRIKIFSQEIYQFVCRLTKELSPNIECPSEETFHTMLYSENVHLFMIKDVNETPVGILTVAIYRTPTGCKAWIEDVVVGKEHRGFGYGKKLVEYAIDFVRNSDADTIMLTSNPSRTEANQLYQVLGFKRYETNVYKIEL